MREVDELLKVEKIETFHDEPGGRSGTSLLELLALLIQRRWAVLAPGLILALAIAAYVPFLPNTYTAEALILPPQQQPSSLAAFASSALGGFGGAGLASQIAMKSAADLYVGMLKSRTISDSMIVRFGLCQVYKTKLLSKARRVLHNRTTFASNKDSLLTISVKDHDPKRAAAMANAFIEELYKQNSRMVVTDASQRRQFFQKRLGQEKDDLAEAEKALKNTQTATGLVAPTGQAEALLRSAGQIRAQISMRQVSLQAIRSYATDENAQVQVLKREIAALQAQLTQLENSGNAASGLEVSAGRLPTAALDYLRKARDVKFHETLFELLAKQYEAALMDEAREAPVIQVIDSATVPDIKSGPSRLTLIMESGLGGCALGALYVVMMHQAGALRRLLRQLSSATPFAGSRSG